MTSTTTERLITNHRPGRKWRLMAGGALVAAIGTTAAGVAFATLTTNGSGTGSASTGSVVLTPGSPASTACIYSSLAPGDLSGPQTCTFSIAYQGSLTAYVSLSVLIETKAGSGASAHTLYDGTGSGLAMKIKDNQSTPVSYTVPTSPTTCPSNGSQWGAAPAGYTCYELDHELVSTVPVSSSTGVTFTVTPKFPATAGDLYQGGTATLSLMAQAVQSAGNGSIAACTAGMECDTTSPGAGAPSWS